jgi:hypothetical protein
MRCRFLVPALLLFSAFCLARPGLADSDDTHGLNKRVAVLEAQVAALVTLTQHQSAQLSAQAAQITALQAQPVLTQSQIAVLSKLSLSDGTGHQTELTLSGVNLHIVNGLGLVPGTTGSPDTDTANGVYAHACNGLGNLILGYNALRPTESNNRTGSHTLVIGDEQDYTSYDGIVAGFHNTLSSPYASGTGGAFNWSYDVCSSVSGGLGNWAFANFSSLSGGAQNVTNAPWSSISGGQFNTANGWWSSISGGQNNSTSTDHAWAGGAYSTP